VYLTTVGATWALIVVVRRQQRLPRHLGDLALPPKGDGRVRAEETFHTGDAVRSDGFLQGAVEQLDLHARAASLGRDGCDRRGGTGEGNLVPGLGALDFRHEIEFEFELPACVATSEKRLPSRRILS